MKAQLRQLRASSPSTRESARELDDRNAVPAAKDRAHVRARERGARKSHAQLEPCKLELVASEPAHADHSTPPMTRARVELDKHAAVLGWAELRRALDISESLLAELLGGRVVVEVGASRVCMPKKTETLLRARAVLGIDFADWLEVVETPRADDSRKQEFPSAPSSVTVKRVKTVKGRKATA